MKQLTYSESFHESKSKIRNVQFAAICTYNKANAQFVDGGGNTTPKRSTIRIIDRIKTRKGYLGDKTAFMNTNTKSSSSVIYPYE
jgi:hypothetical protein